MLTVGLVVLVVLLFLRNLWATAIPSVTVILSLLGSFTAMYLLNFSLDNISLMALTIAIGFVVNRRCRKHLSPHRRGSVPLSGCPQGLARDCVYRRIHKPVTGCRVHSTPVDGQHRRAGCSREFALTVTASILVSALVSLTLAPMLCSRFMRRSNEHGRLYRGIEAAFNSLSAGYRITLDIVLCHQAITLFVFFITIGVTVVMMVQIPKGFIPEPGHRYDYAGVAEAAQDVSSEEMQRLQRILGEVILHDPNVAGFNSQTASTGGNGNAQTANTARFIIVLKPRNERALSASQIINRLRPKIAKVEGVNLFLQATQDITVGGRSSRGSFQYTLQSASVSELIAWSQKDAPRRCGRFRR